MSQYIGAAELPMSKTMDGAQRRSTRASWPIPIPKLKSSKLSNHIFSRSRLISSVRFISKAFAVSSTAPYHWESNLARAYTTTEVYNLLVARNFNHYLYNGDGSGCLTWTTALVRLLETEGVLPQGSEASFLTKVEEVRADPKYWVPAEPDAEFY
jgi:hypothetical protein